METIDEIGQSRLGAVNSARRISIEFDCIRHVNTTDGLNWYVSDVKYGTTVYSFDRGNYTKVTP
jgi:hypothetical protein